MSTEEGSEASITTADVVIIIFLIAISFSIVVNKIGLTWGHFSDGAGAVKCWLPRYSEQCCRLPGTLPLVVVQILLLYYY